MWLSELLLFHQVPPVCLTANLNECAWGMWGHAGRACRVVDTLEGNHQVAVSVKLLIFQHSITFVPLIINGSNWTNWALIGLSAPGRAVPGVPPRPPALPARPGGRSLSGGQGRVKGPGRRRQGQEEAPSGTEGSRGCGRERGAGHGLFCVGPEPGREARGGSVRRNPPVSAGRGKGRAGPALGRSAPELPEGVLAAGPPIRAGPALWLAAAAGGRARIARSAFPGEFPRGGGRGCLSPRRCRRFPPRGCCRALGRGRWRRQQQRRAREAATWISFSLYPAPGRGGDHSGEEGRGEKRLLQQRQPGAPLAAEVGSGAAACGRGAAAGEAVAGAAGAAAAPAGLSPL